MKKALALVSLIILTTSAYSQLNNTTSRQVDLSYFVTLTREDLIKKLVNLPLGILPSDPIDVMLKKIEVFLFAFSPEPGYSDDEYAKAVNIQALKSVKQGVMESVQFLLNRMERSFLQPIIHRSRKEGLIFMLK